LLQLLESELVVGPWWNQIPLLKKDVAHLPILLQNPIVEVAQIRPLQRLPAKHGCKRFARGLKHDVGITVKVHELRPRKHLQEQAYPASVRRGFENQRTAIFPRELLQKQLEC